MVRPAWMQIRLRPASSDRLGFDSSVAKWFREVVPKEGGRPLPTRARWAGSPPTPRPGAARPRTPIILGMRLVRIFTRDSGESAIEIREVPMTGAERPASETFGCDSIFFRETPEGHVQDFHNAPRRQLIFLTSGMLELEASDGHRTLCLPGDLIFAEDVQGKGHITRSLRNVRGFVHVAVREDFDVSRWPLVEA